MHCHSDIIMNKGTMYLQVRARTAAGTGNWSQDIPLGKLALTRALQVAILAAKKNIMLYNFVHPLLQDARRQSPLVSKIKCHLLKCAFHLEGVFLRSMSTV